MRKRTKHRWVLVIPMLAIILSSCLHEEDPGPLQDMEKEYALLDFDRLEMGDAFIITVQQSPFYSVKVKGDRRNIDDLVVEKVGNTLRARFVNNDNRQYATYISITMPTVKGVNFSGATTSTLSGFTEMAEVDLTYSGASVAQVGIEAQLCRLNLSGASKLTASGKATILEGTISGASVYSGFGLETENATLDVSGASKAQIMATSTLKVTATGASTVLYRGSASVTPTVSGASTVQPD